MPAPDDWRRHGQEAFLAGRPLFRRTYTPAVDGRDHDHCEFCRQQFAVEEGFLHQGYVTQNGYHWVCENCFNDFKDEYHWEAE